MSGGGINRQMSSCQGSAHEKSLTLHSFQHHRQPDGDCLPDL